MQLKTGNEAMDNTLDLCNGENDYSTGSRCSNDDDGQDILEGTSTWSLVPPPPYSKTNSRDDLTGLDGSTPSFVPSLSNSPQIVPKVGNEDLTFNRVTFENIGTNLSSSHEFGYNVDADLDHTPSDLHQSLQSSAHHESHQGANGNHDSKSGHIKMQTKIDCEDHDKSLSVLTSSNDHVLQDREIAFIAPVLVMDKKSPIDEKETNCQVHMHDKETQVNNNVDEKVGNTKLGRLFDLSSLESTKVMSMFDNFRMCLTTGRSEQSHSNSVVFGNNHFCLSRFVKSKVAIGWMALFVTLFLLTLSIQQSRELTQLREEILALKYTIAEIENTKVEQDWIGQGRGIVKEWASSFVQMDTDYFFKNNAESNQSTYLDILPGQVHSAIKNITSSTSEMLGIVLKDMKTTTIDILGESFSHMKTNPSVVYITENYSKLGGVSSIATQAASTVSHVSDTMVDIVRTQKHAIIFGALYYKIYECYFFQDSCF
jgi:hypothetical protein